MSHMQDANGDAEKQSINGRSTMDKNRYHVNDSASALNEVKTAGSLTISPELFEKLYLAPQFQVAGDLRKTFANPTPIALLGFVLALSPLSFDLMAVRGSGLDGQATVGTYFFIGGLLMFTGGILEFFLGNTFPFVVFCSFGGYWFSYGAALTPSFNAYAAYSPNSSDPLAGMKTEGYNATFGFFMVFMAILCFMYLVCALRTNIVFVLIFLGLMIDFIMLSAVFFQLAHAHDQNPPSKPSNLQTATGAICLATCIAGWYIFFAQMLASVDFPVNLPVGDLSHFIKGASEKRAKEHAI